MHLQRPRLRKRLHGKLSSESKVSSPATKSLRHFFWLVSKLDSHKLHSDKPPAENLKLERRLCRCSEFDLFFAKYSQCRVDFKNSRRSRRNALGPGRISYWTPKFFRAAEIRPGTREKTLNGTP